jgi:hypothetical protein
MAFRRRRTEWSEFIQRNSALLDECGIPDYILKDQRRFFVFLDHGYDEVGWFEDPHAFFDASFLTDKQIAQLAELVASLIDPKYRVLIHSRWSRS